MSYYSIDPRVQCCSLAEVGKLITPSDFKQILILTSPSVARIESVAAFCDALSSMTSVTVFDKIRPDAPVHDLDELISTTTRPDLIVGIGGGSVLDSSKALSVGWQGATIDDLFYKRKETPQTKILTYAVPTTAGTGAELSYGAILYDEAKSFKSGLRGKIIQPDKVFLDVDLYLQAPSKLIAEVGFDCLTHAVETYLSTASSPMVRYQSVAAIHIVLAHLTPAVAKQRASVEQMAMAACLMGINLAMSTTCLPHRIQYAIGPMTKTSHAQGLIMLYRGWLPVISLNSSFENLCWDLGITSETLISKINNLKTQNKIDYRLGDFGMSEKDVDNISKQVTGNLANDPSYQSIETIKKIILDSL